MHSVRRAAFKLAIGQASRAAAVAAPRPTLLLIASSSAPQAALFRGALAQSQRSFSLTRALASSESPLAEHESAEESVETAADTTVEPPTSTEIDGQPAGTVDKSGAASVPTPHGLFIRNLVFAATEQHLAEAFEKYGEVVSTVIARDARGLSKGYGFVYFNDEETMQKASAGANGSFWHGRRIQALPRTKRADRPARSTNLPLSDRTPSNCLYVGNIPYETTDAELNKLFRSLENITDVRIAVDRSTGWPRGFAHADFVDAESAAKAAQKLEGMTLLGRNLRIDFAAQSRRAAPRPDSQAEE